MIKPLFHDLMDERHINIAAGKHADDLFALDIHLVVEYGRQGRRAGGFHDLLAAFKQQEYGGSDLLIGDRDNTVDILA